MKGIKLTNMQNKSNFSKREKDALVNNATEIAVTELIKVFTEIGLKTHIQCIFENKVNGDKFLLRLTKL